MTTKVSDIFKELGGATAVARLLNAPVTTVFAWKRFDRIPAARLAHLRLAVKAKRMKSAALESYRGE